MGSDRNISCSPTQQSVTLGELPAVYSVTDGDGLPSLEGLFLVFVV